MWWSIPGLIAGCAADRTLLAVPVTVDAAAPSVTDDAGMAITLTAATYTLADVRFEAPAVTTAGLSRWLSPVATALAHPGHDFTGDVAGELVGRWEVDLLGGPSALGRAAMYDGVYATGHLTLPAEGRVRLAGTAHTDAGDRAFDFEIVPDQPVTGIPFDATIDAAAPPEGITLSVELGHALSFVDWSTASDGPLTVSDGVLANTVLFGVVATPSFRLELED